MLNTSRKVNALKVVQLFKIIDAEGLHEEITCLSVALMSFSIDTILLVAMVPLYMLLLGYIYWILADEKGKNFILFTILLN